MTPSDLPKEAPEQRMGKSNTSEKSSLELSKKFFPAKKDGGYSTESGKREYEFRATRGIKLLFLGATILCVLFTMVLWPEFSMRFGTLSTWFWTLIYNPLFALPGIIMIIIPIAGLVALAFCIFYFLVSVRLDDTGIRRSPGNVEIQWQDVAYLTYANRRLRSGGVPHPTQISLLLSTKEGKTLGLPHRFNDMGSLVSLVCRCVEPVLLKRARENLAKGQQISFGKRLAMSRTSIFLLKRNRELPLEHVREVYIAGGMFAIRGKDKKRLFSCMVELVPNAIILPKLFDEISGSM